MHSPQHDHHMNHEGEKQCAMAKPACDSMAMLDYGDSKDLAKMKRTRC